MGLRWTIPPSRIANRLRQGADAAPAAVFAIGQAGASRWESEAKAIAPWEDRTTQARSGLTGEAQREGNNTVVYCYHTADHGRFLEPGTSKMAPRPSIMPAFNSVGPGIVEDAAEVVQRILGGSS